MANTEGTSSTEEGKKSSMRTLLEGGDVFLGCAIGSCLTKLTLRAIDIYGPVSRNAKDMQV